MAILVCRNAGFEAFGTLHDWLYDILAILICTHIIWRVTDTQITLTEKEQTRRSVVCALNLGQLTRAQAAAQLGINVRQLYKLRTLYRQYGDEGLIDRRRFTKGNSRTPDGLKTQILGIIKHDYKELGPTAVHRRLAEECGVTLHLETVRLWMRGAGLSTARRSYGVRRFAEPKVTAASGKAAHRYRARDLPRRLRGAALAKASRPEPQDREVRMRTLQSHGERCLMPVHCGIYGAIQQICFQDDIDIHSLVVMYANSAIEYPEGHFSPPPARLLATVGVSAWQSIELPQQFHRDFASAVLRFDPRITVADAFNHVLWIIVRSFLGPYTLQLDDLLDLKRPFVVTLPGPRARQRREHRTDRYA